MRRRSVLLLGTTPIFIGLISLALRLEEHLASAFWIGARNHVRRRRADRRRQRGCRVEPERHADRDRDRSLTWACYTVTIAPLMRRYSPPYRISALVLAIGWVPLALVSIPPTLGAAVLVVRDGRSGSASATRRRAAFPHEHPLVHVHRPRRRFRCVALREPAGRSSQCSSRLILLSESPAHTMEIAGGLLIFAGIAFERLSRRAASAAG